MIFCLMVMWLALQNAIAKYVYNNLAKPKVQLCEIGVFLYKFES